MFPIIPSMSPLVTSGAVEFAIALPWKFRLKGNIVRQMITRANPRLSAMPTSYGGTAEPFEIGSPSNYVPYFINTARRYSIRGAQALKNRLMPRDSGRSGEMLGWDIDFVSELKEQGLLNIDNLSTAELYNPDGLRRILDNVKANDFRMLSQVYAIISIEILSRLGGIQRFEDRI